MPFSQADYLDVGLDDLREQVPEPSADSQQVIYEDFRIEQRQRRLADTANSSSFNSAQQ